MPYDSIIDRIDASALIPEEVANSIIEDMPQQSLVIQRFTTVRMSRAEQRLPVLSALATAYFVNGDTGLRQTSELQWKNKYLNAEEIAVIVPIPKKVLKDMSFDIWGQARPRMVEAIGKTLDKAVLFGADRPASWPSAIVDGAAAASNSFVRGSIGGQDVAGDISACMSLIEDDGFDVNGFVAAPTFKGSLRNLRDNQNQPIFQPSMQQGMPGLVWGEPITFTKNGAFDQTKASLICGDWTQGILGIREDMDWEILREAVIQDSSGNIIYNFAQQGMVGLLLTIRVAFQIANPITQMNPNDSTRYPFAVLRPIGFSG